MENKKQFYAPVPIVNQKEQDIFEKLTKQYEKMLEPSMAALLGRAAVRAIPEKVKQVGALVGNKIKEEDLYKESMEYVADGFSTIEKYAAKMSISENSIIKKVNSEVMEYNINTLDQICFVRSYQLSKIVSNYKTKDILTAFAEGGATGAGGFWTLPLNLVLSTFLYFRAVQSIAMLYGYDVKNDNSEMMIAGEIFSAAMAPAKKGSGNELGSVVVKIMTMTQANIVKQTAKKSWTAMINKGGIPFLLAQMRALANGAAKKALQNAGKKGLENSIFAEVFEQIGKKLSKETIGKSVPYFSAALGALIDTSQMNKVLEYADIFYQKRFILEKESRIAAYLADNPVIIDAEIIDTEE